MADIQDQITRITNNVADAYDAAESYGATMPAIKNSNNLADTINTINVYEHPTYTPYASGLYKITTDNIGSVTNAVAVEKSDITALGIPAQDTTYSPATTTANGLMSSTDKTKLNNVAEGATAVNETTVSGWGFTKNEGTITGIKMNGTSKGTSGVVDLGTVLTAHQTAKDVNGSNVGTATKGVYINANGKPTAMTYSVNKDVPANAVFTDTTYSVATTSANGLMSSTDKTKLNNIAAGATAVTETTVSGWGFTKNAGTVTGVKMNGTTKGTSGVVDLGTVLTSHQSLSGYVPTSRTVNGKALSSNISLTASDVNITYSSTDIGAGASLATGSFYFVYE